MIGPASLVPSIRELFDQVADLPAADRLRVLSACCPDPVTRSEVLALLRADDASPGSVPSAILTPRHHAGDRRPTIPGHDVLRQLAEGGSSRVYEATCLDTGNRVAIKVIGDDASSSSIERFRQECRVLARLDHPAIVRLHETGTTPSGQVYLVMEFIEGSCIDAWSREEGRTDEQRIDAVLQILAALQHAHAAGVVHRDLKPQNILVNRMGFVRLVDFGVARLTSDGHRTGVHTQTGNLVGTFAYMSPEQADGCPDRIGPATDLYQVAVVLFELLTGRLPYAITARSTTALLKAVLFDARLPLCEVAPRCPKALEAFLARALSIDPSQRPASAESFANELMAASRA
jgi:serine/threonine protein kinase